MSDANVDRKASKDDLRVVQSFYDCLELRNVPGVLALLDPQVQWTEAEGFPYFSGTWVGPEAVPNNLLKRVAADWSSFSTRSERMLVDGPTIISLGAYTGTHRLTEKKCGRNLSTSGPLTSRRSLASRCTPTQQRFSKLCGIRARLRQLHVMSGFVQRRILRNVRFASKADFMALAAWGQKRNCMLRTSR